jgi:HPt (histidine-containing phosphotransfer) domain-containing protein
MTQKVTVRVDREIQDLVPTFLANRQRDLISLREAVQARDFNAVRIIGHNLKGVGGGYGFQEITEIGALIENAAKEPRTEVLDPLIARYASYLDAVEVEFV